MAGIPLACGLELCLTKSLLAMAAIYSGFCALDLVQHLSTAYFAFDAFIVTLLLSLAGNTGEWTL